MVACCIFYDFKKMTYLVVNLQSKGQRDQLNLLAALGHYNGVNVKHGAIAIVEGVVVRGS